MSGFATGRRRGLVLALVCGMLATGCGPSSGESETQSSPPDAASAVASAAAGEAEERARALLRAEARRLPDAVLPADLEHPSPDVRLAAVRALARSGGARAQAALRAALSDEQPAIVAFAAYGLGYFCEAGREADTAALAARAATLLARPPGDDAELHPLIAIARAIGRCGAEAAEDILAAWLHQPRAPVDAVAFGLGDLATARHRLREDTIASLLSAASGTVGRPPATVALYPISRLDHVPPSVEGRLFEVAVKRAQEQGPARTIAIRALARAGEPAVVPIAALLTDSAVSAPERAEAARALAKLGKSGRKALGEALEQMVPDPPTPLSREQAAVLLATVSAIDEAKATDPALARLAVYEAAGDAKADLRRLSQLRCAAAVRIVGDRFDDPRLLECDRDPEPEVATGPRALVEVLDRGRLTGARGKAFRELALSGPLRAREAAIAILAGHPEHASTAELLVAALGAESGLVAEAAMALEKNPTLGASEAFRRRTRDEEDDEDEDDKKKDAPKALPGEAAEPGVAEALLEALVRVQSDIEAQGAVIGAVGALGLRGEVERLMPFCKSSRPTLRERAKASLALLGKEVACDAPPEGGPLPSELAGPLPEPFAVVLDTDVGEMTLTFDARHSPMALGRVRRLVEQGFYDDTVIHRSILGFVTQFGSPTADGYGAPDGYESLRCETSPETFAQGAIGMALAGRDTGSSQLFVMHAWHPHLDGRYAYLGSAKGPWAWVVDGDRIRSAKIAAIDR